MWEQTTLEQSSDRAGCLQLPRASFQLGGKPRAISRSHPKPQSREETPHSLGDLAPGDDIWITLYRKCTWTPSNHVWLLSFCTEINRLTQDKAPKNNSRCSPAPSDTCTLNGFSTPRKPDECVCGCLWHTGFPCKHNWCMWELVLKIED